MREIYKISKTRNRDKKTHIITILYIDLKYNKLY